MKSKENVQKELNELKLMVESAEFQHDSNSGKARMCCAPYMHRLCVVNRAGLGTG